jgi:hypothetical protein
MYPWTWNGNDDDGGRLGWGREDDPPTVRGVGGRHDSQ